MPAELTYLALTAISISLIHTVTGPDHYLPFIALSKSRAWSLQKTITWTVVCGLGHVGSSVLLALGGAALGWSLSKINGLENIRGGIAGWAMLLVGIGYTIYAVVQLKRNRLHKHFEVSGDELFVYEHRDGSMVLPQDKRPVTPWVMFIVFLLGPCEPLIPLLSFPAAQHSFTGMLLLVGVFTLFTLIAMVAMVLIGYYGLSILNTSKLERYTHLLAGGTVVTCGIGMLFLGW